MTDSGEERVQALVAVGRAREDVRAAEARFDEAMMRVWDLGIPNVKIALELDLTETAVRTWFRRRGRIKRGGGDRWLSGHS